MANLIHNLLPMPRRKIAFVLPDDTVKKCVALMTEHNIGALVVRDNKNKLKGIVSERDIIQRCLSKGFDLNTMKASDILFSKVTILSSHDAVEKAMQAMTETKRRHVLVCEKDEVIAILSIGDMLYHLLEDKARVIEHLEQYIHT
jgi:CBS domain-containing protein